MFDKTKLPDRIENKITVCEQKGCWLFDGDPSSNGYQRLWAFNKRHMVHRFIYEFFTGTSIKPELVLDHLCRVRECCNPAHLEPVTQSKNIKRIHRRRKTIG